ncbi:unnamed protein product, partial [Owenia fusiformis]
GTGTFDQSSQFTTQLSKYGDQQGSRSRHDDLFFEDQTRFICQECNVEYPSKACLESHSMVVHNKYCDVCQKRLDNEPHEELLQHGLKHSGLKQYQCEFCYKGFGTNIGVVYHKAKSLICSLCGKQVHIKEKAKHKRLHQM